MNVKDLKPSAGEDSPSNDAARARQLRRTSDRILHAVDDLKAAEQLKRHKKLSTPAFHRLATEVKDKADAVWREAAMEEAAGDALSESKDYTIDDVPPK